MAADTSAQGTDYSIMQDQLNPTNVSINVNPSTETHELEENHLTGSNSPNQNELNLSIQSIPRMDLNNSESEQKKSSEYGGQGHGGQRGQSSGVSFFTKLGATVTAFKLLVLVVDTLNGVIVQGTILHESRNGQNISKNLALGYYIAPGLVFLLGTIVYASYTAIDMCRKKKNCKGFYEYVVSACLILGGLLYYFGDNLLNFNRDYKSGISVNDLETVMQIHLIFALLFFRFVPRILARAQLTSYKDSKGDKDAGIPFSHVALNTVALALDCDAIFSIIQKTQSSCTAGSDGTCSAVSDTACPTGNTYKGLLWGLYGVLLTGYVIITIASFVYNKTKNAAIDRRDIICAIALVIFGLISLAFFLIADNPQPLQCEFRNKSQTTLIKIRLAFLVISCTFYIVAFVYQVVLHIRHNHSESTGFMLE